MPLLADLGKKFWQSGVKNEIPHLCGGGLFAGSFERSNKTAPEISEGVADGASNLVPISVEGNLGDVSIEVDRTAEVEEANDEDDNEEQQK